MKRLFALVLILVLVLSFAGCSKKTALTLDTFQEIMEDADFEVVDVTDTTETNGINTTILVAMNDDFQIEFYQFEDEKTAEAVYANNLDTVEKKERSSHVTVNLPGFNKHEQASDSDFYYLAHIGSTMIYCHTDKDNKSDVLEIVKMLGYT